MKPSLFGYGPSTMNIWSASMAWRTPAGFAIHAILQQTMIGMLGREFRDRKHEGTATHELLQMANTRELCS